MAHGPDTAKILKLFNDARDKLDIVGVHDYNITSLPNFPPSVVSLSISYVHIPVMPNFPPGIRSIRLNNVTIDNAKLPPLPEGLLELYVVLGNVRTLPALPSTLKILDCNENGLISLPVLPPTLIHLGLKALWTGSLKSLPDLPPTLEYLYCVQIGLTSLPALPPALKQLVCHNNRLTSLPDLPPTLIQLLCDSNKLTTLPALPQTLTSLRCSDNPIKTLTPPCPPALRQRRVDNLVSGEEKTLEPNPLPKELLGDYMDRIAVVAEVINIPEKQTDIITSDPILDGTRMVDFHGEKARHRYYTEETYNSLNPKKNPFDRKDILPGDLTRYTAKLDSTMPVQQAGRRKTRKHKRRAKKTRRRHK